MKFIRFSLALLSLASAFLSPRAIAADDGPLDLVQALTSFEWQCSSASAPQRDGAIRFLLGGRIINQEGAPLPWNWQLTGSHAVQIYDQAKNQQTLAFNADLTEFTSSGFDGSTSLQGVRLAAVSYAASSVADEPVSNVADTVISTDPAVYTTEWVRGPYGRFIHRRLYRAGEVRPVIVRQPRIEHHASIVGPRIDLKKHVGGPGNGGHGAPHPGRPKAGGHPAARPAPQAHGGGGRRRR